MAFSFANKVVLITGGTKGIGRAAAIKFAAGGAKVAVNYSSDSKSAEDTLSEIGKDNGIAIKGDAGSVEDCKKMVDETVKAFGKIDVLVPNAGLLLMADLEQTKEEDYDRLMRVNVKGPYFLAQAAVPHMPSGSHIVLISTSVCDFSGAQPNYLLYATSKGAIEQMTRLLAKDLARKGISVNAIAPGPTATELFMRGKPEGLVKAIVGASPFGRLGKPEEQADGILWLASEQSSWMSGQIMRVNGAMTIG